MEDDLWHIFTAYSLHGNTRDPFRLPVKSFVRLCKDCFILSTASRHNTLASKDSSHHEDSGNDSSSFTAISLPELNLLITSSILADSDRQGKCEMIIDFLAFQKILVCLAERCYTQTKSKESALQSLLLNMIWPNARRRIPVSIVNILGREEISELLSFFQDSLRQIFKFYCMSTESCSASRYLDISVDNSSRGSKSSENKRAYEGKLRMTYSDAQRFAKDFAFASRSLCIRIRFL